MAELVADAGIEGLPLAAGRCRLSALPRRPLAVVTRPGDGVRIGIGQWLVEGEGGVDVSDAFVGLAVEGADAAEVLARLLPVDLAAGLPVRTLLRHTPVLVSARGGRLRPPGAQVLRRERGGGHHGRHVGGRGAASRRRTPARLTPPAGAAKRAHLPSVWGGGRLLAFVDPARGNLSAGETRQRRRRTF